MSALHPTAAEERTSKIVSFVPIGDIAHFRDLRKGISLLVPVPVGSHAAEGLE